MKLINMFRKQRSTKVSSPSADELQMAANAFVKSVIASVPPEQSRVIELAVKNGTLSLSIAISPTPGIRINLDPGEKIFFDAFQS